MKKKYIFAIALCSSFLLSSSPIFGDSTAERETNGAITTQGLLGTETSDKYTLEANNFIIHVKDVPRMDILTLSNAKLVSNEGDISDRLTASSNVNLKAPKVGVYEAAIVLEEEPSIQTTISIFVVDDTTISDGQKIIYGHDFEMKQSERQTLTAVKAKELSGIRAYDVKSGGEETEKVSVNKKQLEDYIQGNNLSPMPLDWSLSSYEGRVVTKRVYIKTVKDTHGSSLPPGKDNNKTGQKKSLPTLGAQGVLLFVVIGLLFMFSAVFLVLFLKRKKEERSDEA